MARERGRPRAISRRRIIQGSVLGATGILGLGAYGCASTPATPTSAAGAPTPPGPTAPAGPTTAAAPASTPARQAKYGGTHKETIGTSDMPHLDVHMANTAALINQGAGMCYSQLLWFKNGPGVKMPNFTVEGDLAEKWDQADELTYVFKLRSGVKFQNLAPVSGREVVAEDVVQSFRRQIDLKVNAGFLQGVKSIEAPDKATVKITLDQPNADFLWSAAQPFCKVLPPETFAKGDLKEGPVIGSGPWMLGTWEKMKSVDLLRNPDYYLKGKPYLDKVQWQRLGDPSILINAFRTQNLDVLVTAVTKSQIDAVKKEHPELELSPLPGVTRFEIGLKGDRPPFNDLRVRKALSLAINRQEVIDSILEGVGHLESGISLASPDQALPEAELKQLHAYDPEGAKKLLQEAGVSNVDFELQVGNFQAGLVAQAGELIQAQLRKVGFNPTLKVIDGTTYTTQVRIQGNYIANLGLQNAPSTTSAELYNRHYTKGSQYTTGLTTPDLDGLIDRQATLVKDPAGRARLLQDIQRKIIGLYGYIMIATYDQINVNWPYVKDWNPNSNNNNTQADFMWTWHDK
jgi:ABC-type transport system substrate-binding protein